MTGISDAAVKAALKTWFGRDQEFGAGQEAVMRAALQAAMEVERARFRVASIRAGRLVAVERHGPPPTCQSGVSRDPRTGAR